jgi:hypothetical protein
MGNVAETIRKHMVHSGTGPTNVNLSSNNRACARRRASQSIVFQDGRNHSSEEAYNRTECTWMFIPSLFSCCIELRFVNLLGSLQSSLRTYPVIRYDHPVWDMCKSNDVEGIQRLFSNRQVSPFSVNFRGWTLLHVRIIAAGLTR